MPNIDEMAKAWQSDAAGRFGRTVAAVRRDQRLTAAQLADRTREIGFPIHRVAITKIETNSRGGKLDIAEVITLALALGRPPVELLYPSLPDGEVEMWPGVIAPSIAAVQWFSGEKKAPLNVLRGRPDDTITRTEQARNFARLRTRRNELAKEHMLAQLLPDGPNSKDETARLLEVAQASLTEIEEDFRGKGWPVTDGKTRTSTSD